MKKTMGIIGGMGPLATADLFMKIVRMTSAQTDQEHIRIIIDNNTTIPDRTNAILARGPSPIPQMVESARLLEQAGADFLIMPCNTAHYYYDELSAQVKLKILHMIELTAEEAKRRHIRRVGLLATDGTIASGIYEAKFMQTEIGVDIPSTEGQREVMSLIYQGVKAGQKGYDCSRLNKELHTMLDKGTECFIMGCTELPIAFSQYQLDYPALDPTAILAAAAIVYADGKLRIYTTQERQHVD